MPRNPAPTKQKKEPGAKPLVESQVDVTVPPPDPPNEEPPAPPVQVIERRIETVTVEIPLGEPPHRFQTIHIGGNEFLLYGEHAQTWARLRQALRDKDARTDDGKEVRSGPDILRWLLEQFASC